MQQQRTHANPVGSSQQQHNFNLSTQSSQHGANISREEERKSRFTSGGTHRNEYHETDRSSERSNNNYSREFKEYDKGFDELKYRELCLNAAGKTNVVANYLTKIKDHIIREASLEWEVRYVADFDFVFNNYNPTGTCFAI